MATPHLRERPSRWRLRWRRRSILRWCRTCFPPRPLKSEPAAHSSVSRLCWIWPAIPAGGRTEETYGEDPYLTARIGVAAVKGFQGPGPAIDKQHVIATLKHFAVHGQPEGGTNVAPGNLSRAGRPRNISSVLSRQRCRKRARKASWPPITKSTAFLRTATSIC